VKRLFRSTLAVSVLLALTGCYGIEGLIQIGEDDGTGTTVSINMGQGVDRSIFQDDDARAIAYISELYGDEWLREPLVGESDFATLVLGQSMETPAEFSDKAGNNTVTLTRGTAEQRPDGRPEYVLAMDLNLPQPLENTSYVGVGFVLEYPEAWQIRVLSDGGATITRVSPGVARVIMTDPGEYSPLIVFFPPWEPPPLEAEPAPEEVVEEDPDANLGGEEPPLVQPDDDSASGLVDNRDLESAASSEGTEVEELNIEGALAEAVTEITRDGGMVEAEGARFPARSLTGVIPVGATVEVLGIGDTYLFVQEVEEESGTGLWILVGVLVLLLVAAIVMIVVVLRRRQSPTPTTT
jgi:membrane protein implicated in regulation of membrane protease activity